MEHAFPRANEIVGNYPTVTFWLLVLPGLLLGAYAQWRIKANVAKYSQVSTKDGITGAEVARRLLDARGLQDVKIEATPGMLTDHYDPRTKIIRLSQDVYFTPSVAAAGIAAHEAGHAVQDAEDYLPMEARTYTVPVVQLASRISMAVRGGADAADAITHVGWRDSFRLVVPRCVPHFAG